MIKSPITDKDIGVVIDHETKFADIRQKSLNEDIDRKRKAKRNKKEKSLLPEYSIDQELVVCPSVYGKDRSYLLVKVIDIAPRIDKIDIYEYFCVVLKCSSKKYLPLIGHIVTVGSSHWFFSMNVINVDKNSIRWIEK